MDRESPLDGRPGPAGAPGVGSDERLQLALEAGRMGTWEWQIATGRVAWSSGLEEIHGLAPGTFDGTFAAFQHDIHPDDRERVLETISGAVEHGRDHHVEYRIVCSDGSLRWVEGRGRLFRDRDGRPSRMVGVCIDVTERKESEQRQRLLVEELNHRVKNLLAIIQSIAGQTLREAPEPAAFRQAFLARLAALDNAHTLLTREQWQGASLADIVAGALAPFAGEQGHEAVQVEGPPVMVPPNASVTLSLVLHELATNAAKYGALSVPGGRVEVAWQRFAGEPGIELSWVESGGPPVEAADRQGFGSRLITLAAAQLGGEAELRREPEGVALRLRLPLPAAGTAR